MAFFMFLRSSWQRWRAGPWPTGPATSVLLNLELSSPVHYPGIELPPPHSPLSWKWEPLTWFASPHWLLSKSTQCCRGVPARKPFNVQNLRVLGVHLVLRGILPLGSCLSASATSKSSQLWVLWLSGLCGLFIHTQWNYRPVREGDRCWLIF